MTEEEKKAIEYLKDYIKSDLNYFTIDFNNNLRISMNLIEKLQKENEKWKENARIAEENDTTLVLDVNQACKELGISEDTIIADELADKIKEKYILKDKIREKIKELEDWNSEYSNRINHHQEYTLTALVQNLLKELLKEE